MALQPLKKILLDKYLRRNLPDKIEDNDVHLVFTDNGEFFINKVDGSLLKISDIVTTNFIDMHNITNPSNDKLYICTDEKAIYIYTTEFELFMGGESDELIQVKQSLEALSSDFNSYKQSNNDSISSITTTLNQLNNELDTLSENISNNISQLNESLSTLSLNLTNVKNDLNNTNNIVTSINNTLTEFNNSIDTINANIDTINTNLANIDSDIQSINIDIDELKKGVKSLNDTTSNIIDRMNVKEYNVEFAITQKLSNIEVEDIFDLSNLVFNEKESLIIESITAKTTVKPNQVIIAELIHRSINNEGEITDLSIGQVALSENIIKNMVTVEPLSYNDGYLVLKVLENGNNHDNLRITTKIKKTILT